MNVWFQTPTASIEIALAGVKDEPMVVSAPKAPLELPEKVRAELKSALAAPGGRRSRQQPSTVLLRRRIRLSSWWFEIRADVRRETVRKNNPPRG
jgi:hypothetical protein